MTNGLLELPRERIRFGCYLRPSPAMCRAVAGMHDLLARQYGLRAAGRFMPHATLKGFFRSDAPLAELVARLDGALAGRAAFPVHNTGIVPFARESVVLDIHPLADGRRNELLQALHEAVWDALAPLVHRECDFTPREFAGPHFHAHLTLAMADVPERFFAEILHFVAAPAPIGPADFPAEILQLSAFASDDWAGAWWASLRWGMLRSWRLAPRDDSLGADAPGTDAPGAEAPG